MLSATRRKPASEEVAPDAVRSAAKGHTAMELQRLIAAIRASISSGT